MSAPTTVHLAFSEQGGDPDFVEIAPAAELHLGQGSLSLLAWIKPWTWGENDQGRILDHGGDTGSNNAGWSFHLENNPSLGSLQGLRFQVNGNSSFVGTSDPNVVALDVWQHVAVTLEAGALTFYVNGAPAGTTQSVPTPLASTFPVRIGLRAFDLQRAFSGAIDDVSVWDRALTQQEIQSAATMELTGTETGLLAYYPLNEAGGQTAFDGAGSGHDGQLGSLPTADPNDPQWQTQNQPPDVNAGRNQRLTLPFDTALLNGDVTDDGIPAPVTTMWELVSGPGGVVFSTPNQLSTEATLDTLGTYVLRLTADDGALFASDEITVISQSSPYPPSTVITDVTWAPEQTIVRDALGSDNWPITWADDGDLYTAYGDGIGFDPTTAIKLSTGYAKVAGPPTNFVGTDIPSPTGEALGGGPSGRKPSGMLMVDGVLYQWARNANNNGEQCRLGWSADYAATWQWSSWTFAELGYCALLNFGQNYAGARDGFVYMYSPDTPSAYRETDALVLTRVPKAQVVERTAYEFFQGLDASGTPIWTPDVSARQPVFSFTGGVNRLDVTYNHGLGRYMMTLRSRARNGGVNQFSIFEAREPWGPWSVVYYTERWEGGELGTGNHGWGESQHIPSKWISADGRELYLVFSGSDAFSVRQGTLTVVPDDTPPSVALTFPSNGAQVSGLIRLEADASDDFALSSVGFSVDGAELGVVTQRPYEWDWDTTGYRSGPHSVTVTATDTSANVSSASINVDLYQVPACSDGIDNDGDSLVDLDDPGCLGAWDWRETQELCGLGVELPMLLAPLYLAAARRGRSIRERSGPTRSPRR